MKKVLITLLACIGLAILSSSITPKQNSVKASEEPTITTAADYKPLDDTIFVHAKTGSKVWMTVYKNTRDTRTFYYVLDSKGYTRMQPTKEGRYNYYVDLETGRWYTFF